MSYIVRFGITCGGPAGSGLFSWVTRQIPGRGGEVAVDLATGDGVWRRAWDGTILV